MGVQVTLLEQSLMRLPLCTLGEAPGEAPGDRSLQLLWEKAGLREHASAPLCVFGGRFRVVRTTAVRTASWGLRVGTAHILVKVRRLQRPCVYVSEGVVSEA